MFGICKFQYLRMQCPVFTHPWDPQATLAATNGLSIPSLHSSNTGSPHVMHGLRYIAKLCLILVHGNSVGTKKCNVITVLNSIASLVYLKVLCSYSGLTRSNRKLTASLALYNCVVVSALSACDGYRRSCSDSYLGLGVSLISGRLPRCVLLFFPRLGTRPFPSSRHGQHTL